MSRELIILLSLIVVNCLIIFNKTNFMFQAYNLQEEEKNEKDN